MHTLHYVHGRCFGAHRLRILWSSLFATYIRTRHGNRHAFSIRWRRPTRPPQHSMAAAAPPSIGSTICLQQQQQSAKRQTRVSLSHVRDERPAWHGNVCKQSQQPHASRIGREQIRIILTHIYGVHAYRSGVYAYAYTL